MTENHKYQHEKYKLYETYTNYIDSSTITVEHYHKKPFYGGQQKYLQRLNTWVQQHNLLNKPLVFKTQPGVGTKTLLINWEKQLKQAYKLKKEKVLTIMHFASLGGNNSNFFYSLYRIIIKLRQALKLKQNIDLLQQKIRKYFSYWLDFCSSQIKRQLVIYCSQEIYDKIVIVIQGVDKFIDLDSGKEINLAFWLPQTFPEHIKVIVTTGRNSDALQHLEKQKCEIITLQASSQIGKSLLNKSLNKQTILNIQTQKNLMETLQILINKISSQSGLYNFIQVFNDCLLIDKKYKSHQYSAVLKEIIQKKLSINLLQKIHSLQQLYQFIFGLWTDYLPFKSKVASTFKYLVLTQKGLTIKQIMILTKLTAKEWSCLQIAIGGLLSNYNGLYSIKSTSFSQFLLDNETNINISAHEQIANALENTPNSIRKLQEQTYHLFVAKGFFKLKQIISNIQNFLLLFNPNNKYELSRYWQKLQEKGFDPVIEYNKAIEGFSMHYHPTDQNIFRIIVQVSRFLKQFSDFQTCQTPNFRHPFIEGNMAQLQKIGLLKELSDLEIYVDNSFGQEQQTQQISIQEQIRHLRQKYFPKEQQNGQIPNIDTEMPTISSKIKIKKKTNQKILSEIEQLNVDVPMNRSKFRNYYLQNLQQYMKKQQVNSGKEETYFDIDQGSATTNTPQSTHYPLNKIKQNYRLRQIKPSLYYYKRWIWIQFPWVCISLHNNYSNTPQLCRKLETEDMDSVDQQAKYTKQALIVAIDAKQRKKKMFSPKDNEQTESLAKFRGTMTGNLYREPRYDSRTGFRTQAKFNSIPDMSLNSLTKELEIRRKNIQKNGQLFVTNNENSCEQDMKFITQRKQFEAPSMDGIPANQILPKLKWVIKQHTSYQLSYIKTHIQEKKKKLNKIIYQNKKLAETYKELKLKQNLNKNNQHQQEGQKYNRKNKKLEQLYNKKKQVITNFCKSLLQKQRLKIILKLCSGNKTKNQEYLNSLNYFLQNLKKMINWEKLNMKVISQELEDIKLLQDKKGQIQIEKQKNKNIVEKQVENYLQQKNKLQEQIQNITLIIAEDIKDQKDKLENSLTGHIKNRQQKTIAMMQQKKTKQLQQKLQKISNDYQMLQKLFQFQDFNFENSPKFIKLLQENQRNKKLKIAYFERKNKLEEVTRQYEKLKQKYQENRQICELKTQNKPKEYKKEQQDEEQTNLTILLDNISLKLGVKKEHIISTLQSRLQEIKEKRKDKYQQIMNLS